MLIEDSQIRQRDRKRETIPDYLQPGLSIVPQVEFKYRKRNKDDRVVTQSLCRSQCKGLSKKWGSVARTEAAVPSDPIKTRQVWPTLSAGRGRGQQQV